MKTATFVLAAIALALILPREAVSATKTYAFRTGQLLTQPDPFQQSILDQVFFPPGEPADWYAELVIEVDCGTQSCTNLEFEFLYDRNLFTKDYGAYKVHRAQGFTDGILSSGVIRVDSQGNVYDWRLRGSEYLFSGDWVLSTDSASWGWGNDIYLDWGSSRAQYCVQTYGHPPPDQNPTLVFDYSSGTCWNGAEAPTEFNRLDYAPGTWVTLPQSCDDFDTSPFYAGASAECGPLPVPLPASLPLLFAGVAGLAWVSRNRKAARSRQFSGGQG